MTSISQTEHSLFSTGLDLATIACTLLPCVEVWWRATTLHNVCDYIYNVTLFHVDVKGKVGIQ